ncbi:hybrid sensor histidine kinase/response regulator [Mucilaginibacter auburnensis]|uniref:Sensory/regulatory protein RpfC n=1 Tax=Mucilaginibacter auburnensis TaxID=1457233 RepID=A0A2H9VM70_9SPHI|nr:response regulator [Mucilaginibacter auburnensis]PJJ79424.1 PAS domain S-box-containing protein [Mucilaginibacter auburnensis]
MPAPINILIVDDREENIIALEALLARDDIKIFSTTSPNEGLRIAWENHIAIGLIDVQMPEMDGFEFAEMLKSNPRTKDILILFVTAISKETKYAVKGLGAGAVDYLYKPLDPYITSAKVDSFIQLARYQADIIQKNEELYNFSLIVKNSADIISVVNAESFGIISINPAVERILGFTPEKLTGTSIIDLTIESERAPFRTALGRIIKDNIASSVFEYQFNTFSKAVIWVECRIAYRNRTLFLNISDISAQKSYQEQLVKSKELAEYGKKAKETFLANMSHELRTPVNGIIGISNLLRKTDLTEQQRSMIELLEVSSQSLLGVINDVLDISKIDAGKFSIVRTPGNLHELIRSVYRLLKFKADEEFIEFFLEIDPQVPEYIIFDSLRLNQILMNLLSNALKFTKRGYVKLNVSVIEKQDNKVRLKFNVEDTGIGIPQHRLGAIFNSFEQAEDDTATKYGGTGLGLAIVKKLAELKGGDLIVNSQVNKGSVFTFTNWYTLAPKPKDEVEITANLTGFSNLNILVAEDNLINQFMLSKILKDWQVNVDIVSNGLRALEKLSEKNYDIILMDTHMPEMNGYQTAKKIRLDFDEPKRSIPIISLSAASFDHEQQEAIASGMNDVLGKPFQPDQLHRMIEKLVNER